MKVGQPGIRFIWILFLLPLSSGIAQHVTSDNKQLEEAFNLAINTIDINTRRGILAAGADYGGEWTRDIAINSWSGVSMIRPDVAERSLWSVTANKDTIKHEYWDKIIWTLGAFNHYQVNGDIMFLKDSYACASRTMMLMEHLTFDKSFGLFKGPSVFNDGIAGYPSPVYDSANTSSAVVDHKNSYQIKTLSTNCVFYGSYKALADMSAILKLDKNITITYQKKAEDLKKNILLHFYNTSENCLYYMIDHTGKIDASQEGLGIAFAILFDIVPQEKALALTQHMHTYPLGITSIYPDFKRYSQARPGRHNNLIWPMVNGFYALALRKAGNEAGFIKEFNGLTSLALDADKGDYNFREIYSPYTGKPHGGWQSDTLWVSCKHQTWSATAYLNMVIKGLLGFSNSNSEIVFKPLLPPDVKSFKITSLPFRKALLDIEIKGSGKTIKSFTLDGSSLASTAISTSLSGIHKIKIQLE